MAAARPVTPARSLATAKDDQRQFARLRAECCFARQAAVPHLLVETRCFDGLGSLAELAFVDTLAIAEGVDVEEALFDLIPLPRPRAE
jgi:hypothetical protein